MFYVPSDGPVGQVKYVTTKSLGKMDTLCLSFPKQGGRTMYLFLKISKTILAVVYGLCFLIWRRQTWAGSPESATE